MPEQDSHISKSPRTAEIQLPSFNHLHLGFCGVLWYFFVSCLFVLFFLNSKM